MKYLLITILSYFFLTFSINAENFLVDSNFKKKVITKGKVVWTTKSGVAVIKYSGNVYTCAVQSLDVVHCYVINN